MIKQGIVAIILLLPLGGWAQEKFTVSGKIEHLDTPAKAYMVYVDQGNQIIDSANIKSGAFTFTGSVSEPTLANLAVDHEGLGINALQNPDLVNIYLERGTIVVEAVDSISRSTISGTELNADHQRLTNSVKPIIERMKLLASKYESATEEQMRSEEFMGNLQAEYSAIEEEIRMKQRDFIKANPGSLISLFSLRDIVNAGGDLDEVIVLFEGLDSKLRKTALGQELGEKVKIAKTLTIGAPAPDFSQADTAGNPIQLKDFRGKYVLLEFWASWCQPCRMENPNLVDIYADYKDKDFTILGISLDRTGERDAWIKAIQDDKLSWTQVSDLNFWQNEVAQLYDVQAIPKNFLIDPEGKIVGKNLWGDALREQLDVLL